MTIMLMALGTVALGVQMAKINGQLLICDKCGNQQFLKYIGKGVTDGG